MTVTLYGINNCDTCRKARRWLEDRGTDYTWHDLRRDGLAAETVCHWLTVLGENTLINRRGRSWRECDEATKARLEAGYVDAFLQNPTVIKRPILADGEQAMAGFKPETWTETFPL